MRRAEQSNKAVIPNEPCGHCGKRFGDDYWVVNGEGTLLHLPCFDPYRGEKKKKRDMIEDFLKDDA